MGKRSKAGGGRDFWDGLSGWKAVDVGDALLLGSEEYGFCGLEELDGSALGDLVIPADGTVAKADAEEQQLLQLKQQKGKKRKHVEAVDGAAGDDQPSDAAAGSKGKKPKGKAAARKGSEEAEAGNAGVADAAVDAADTATGSKAGAADDHASVAALKAQLVALAAENRQLKRQQKKEARLEKRAAAAAKRKEERAARRAAAAEAEAAKAAAAAEAAARVDVSAWKELQLYPAIEQAIAALGFEAPTHVQAECLPAAIRDRRDVIGAAQTGSGKTLAFGLPIMQLLLQERVAAGAAGSAAGGLAEGDAAAGADAAAKGVPAPQQPSKLRALILAPTRELALQVCDHLQAVGKACGVWVVPIVGGISALKQERLLSKHPEVVVATPGRLWDLMREGQAHVTDLSRLSFLVIDEADRMVQQGHYGELSSILGAIPTHQQLAMAEAPEPEDEPEGKEPVEKLGATDGEERDGEEGEGKGDDEEAEEEEGRQRDGAPAAADPQQREQDERRQGQRSIEQRPRRMQTFVFSATLTLPATLRKRLRKGGGGASGSSDLDTLMDKIPFRGKPKIVDLTSQGKLADKVEEAYIACGESERDEYLYCLLAKHPGRTIVFVNAISSVRRLAAILKLLGLPAQPLHAGMQQRQRLKALDRFRADANAVLVATDVAARGLDIKDVRCVVHYQLPASVDVYVHRSGRTARADAEGVSIALVTPKENARFLALLKAMKREDPPEFPLDTSLLPAVHKRVRLAVRLDDLERRQSKTKAERSWRRQHAEELGIELSEDSEEEAVEGRRLGKKAQRDRGGKRGPEEAETAAAVRAELAALLAEPLQPGFSRKWFTGGAAAAVMAAVDPSAPAAGGGKKRGKRAREAAAAAAASGEAEGGATAAPKTVQTVSQAVALAQQRSDSRSKAAEATASKLRSRQQTAGAGAAGSVGGKKAQKGKGRDPRAAAMQAALAKALSAKQRKKAGGGGRGMLVIPQALGRDAVGPSALQVLRQKLGGS